MTIFWVLYLDIGVIYGMYTECELHGAYLTQAIQPTAGRQITASDGRGLDWFFAEETAAIRARQIFGKAFQPNRINVRHIPAVVK